jgi:subtilisin family serine protease
MKTAMIKNIVFPILLLLCSVLIDDVNAQVKLTPALLEEMEAKTDDDFISINIRLINQFDTERLQHKSRAFSDHAERRTYVSDALQRFSAQEQNDLLLFLKEMEALGKARQITPLWIVNLVNAEVKPEVVGELMSRKDLSQLDHNRLTQVLEPGKSEVCSPDEGNKYSGTTTWQVDRVRANKVWDEGYKGEDIIVAVLDTGINYDHKDLKGNMWEHPDFPFHGYSFISHSYATIDGSGHGTHCAGIIAGTGSFWLKTGVAPASKLMSLQVMDAWGRGTEAGVWAALQFAVEYKARVASLSLGWPHAAQPDRSGWRTVMNNVMEAGLVVVAAAGNEGSDPRFVPPSEVRTPGDIPPPWLHPDQDPRGGVSAVISVGASTKDETKAEFSSKGPVTWQNIQPFNDYPFQNGRGLIRPDLLAPGAEIISLSHSNNEGYVIFSGTSMATPVVAGAIALMLSKNPDLSPEDICRILEESAIPYTQNKSDGYGSGRIDALAAINMTPHAGINYVCHEIDDSEGNGDGAINPGELIRLNICFENKAKEVVKDVAASLKILSPFAELVDSVVLLGDFDEEERRQMDGLFAFRLTEDAPGNHIIEYEISVFSLDEADIKWASRASDMVHGPHLTFSGLSIHDHDRGNGDGKLDIGEVAEIQVIMKNTGQTDIELVEAGMRSDSGLLSILSGGPFEIRQLAIGEEAELTFDVHAHGNVPFESLVNLGFTAQTKNHRFEQGKGIIVGNAPVYNNGKIPSTMNANVTTSSRALEPGRMSVSIPEGASINSVDVQYSITSVNGAWVDEQRSFLRCLSSGGVTEHTVYEGTGSGSGTVNYNRKGLNIANNAHGGGEIEFELHVFRKWGGAGSNVQYTYVPDSSWKIVVHYTLPAREVLFRVKNQLNQSLKDAAVDVGKLNTRTNTAGEATLTLSQCSYFYSVRSDKHIPKLHQTLDVKSANNVVDVELTRIFDVQFTVTNASGDTIQDPIIVFDNDTLPAGHRLIEGLLEGRYHYTVSAENYQDHESHLDIDSDDVHLMVAMNEIGTGLADPGKRVVSIFPNPARETVFIDLSGMACNEAAITLINTRGQTVKSRQIASGGLIEMSVSGLTPGVYFLRITDAERQETYQLIVH